MKISCARPGGGIMRLKRNRISNFSVLIVILYLIIFTAGIARADDRFIDNGDGTVTDSKTGLMWAQTDSMGDITWLNAKLYSENIILGVYNDWRMPTVKELETLFDETLEKYETICGHRVKTPPLIELSCGFIWSSEERSISAFAYNFSRGYVYKDRKTRYRGFRALPMRDVTK